MRTERIERLLRRMAVKLPDAGLDRRVAATLEREGPTMLRWNRKRLAASLACVLLVMAAAWAAPKVIRTFVVERSVRLPEEVQLKDGTTVLLGGVKTVVLKSDDPDMTQEKAEQRHQEVKELAAKGEANLVKVVEDESGLKTYIYEFTLSDGTVEEYALSYPLVSPEEEAARQQELKELMRAGKGELIETITADSGLKVYRYKYTLPDGTIMTVGSNLPPDSE